MNLEKMCIRLEGKQKRHISTAKGCSAAMENSAVTLLTVYRFAVTLKEARIELTGFRCFIKALE